MTEAVLDASALIALLRGEKGAERVAEVMQRCCISAVNLCETFSKLDEYGRSVDEIASQVERLQIPVIPFDGPHARIAASLSTATRPFGLSLGDRVCLALAMQTGRPAFTADATWQKCKLGVKIVTIR